MPSVSLRNMYVLHPLNSYIVAFEYFKRRVEARDAQPSQRLSGSSWADRTQAAI
jgi:hypothetical protein